MTQSSGRWRRRLLRYYLPLALASGLALVLWLNLPLFQTAGLGGHGGSGRAAGGATGHQAGPQGTQTAQHSGQTGGHGAAAPAAQAGAAHQPVDQGGHGSGQTRTPDERQTTIFLARFTTATGYVALGLLAATLLIGPANLLLRRRNPISSYVRRDVGTWTAVVSVVHVIAGFEVHGAPGSLGERIRSYFLAPDGSPLTTQFGLANWTGLAATAIVLALLATSSNVALRRLKARPWKWLQRLTYALFALVVAHAVFYGALSRLTSPSTLLLGLIVVAIVAGQTTGVWLWRRRYARASPQPA